MSLLRTLYAAGDAAPRGSRERAEAYRKAAQIARAIAELEQHTQQRREAA